MEVRTSCGRSPKGTLALPQGDEGANRHTMTSAPHFVTDRRPVNTTNRTSNTQGKLLLRHRERHRKSCCYDTGKKQGKLLLRHRKAAAYTRQLPLCTHELHTASATHYAQQQATTDLFLHYSTQSVLHEGHEQNRLALVESDHRLYLSPHL